MSNLINGESVIFFIELQIVIGTLVLLFRVLEERCLAALYPYYVNITLWNFRIIFCLQCDDIMILWDYKIFPAI